MTGAAPVCRTALIGFQFRRNCYIPMMLELSWPSSLRPTIGWRYVQLSPVVNFGCCSECCRPARLLRFRGFQVPIASVAWPHGLPASYIAGLFPAVTRLVTALCGLVSASALKRYVATIAARAGMMGGYGISPAQPPLQAGDLCVASSSDKYSAGDQLCGPVFPWCRPCALARRAWLCVRFLFRDFYTGNPVLRLYGVAPSITLVAAYLPVFPGCHTVCVPLSHIGNAM